MRDKFDWDRMVIITALHGERFHGWVPEDKGDPNEYLNACNKEGVAAELHKVRNLIGHKEPKTDQMGNFIGMATMMTLMAIDMFPGPLDIYHVIPSGWYFPGSVEGAKKPMMALLENAEQNEVRNSAIAAGIHPATGPLPGMGGRH